MSSFRVLNLRYLRRQPLRAFLGVTAIAAAAAMAVASVTLIASLDRSMSDVLKGVSGPAPIRVIGPLVRGGVDPSVVGRIEGVPGVAGTVPVVSAATKAAGRDGTSVHIIAIGLDCRVETLVGAFGCAGQFKARSDGPLLISPRLANEVGTDGEIRTDLGRVPIKGAVLNDSLDTTNSGRVVIFDLRTAQRLFDRGENFDAVYVGTKTGIRDSALIARLERAVGSQNTVLRSSEPAPWMNVRGPLIPLLSMAALMTLGLSGLLVFNILSLSLGERRRDIAVASAVGTSPRVLIAGIVGESALLGFVGGILGIAFGIVVSHPLVQQFASVITEQALGLKVNVYVPMSAYVVGIVTGTSIGAVAAFIPALRAQRLDLAAELHGRAVLEERRSRGATVRIVVLLALVAAALGLSRLSQMNGGLERWQPPLGALSLLASSVLVFAAAGALAPPLLRGALRSLRSRGGTMQVALANLVSRPARSKVIAMSVGAAVGMSCVLGALAPAIRATVGASDLGTQEGRILVGTLPLNNSGNIDARPSRALLSKIEDVPGVAGVDEGYAQVVSDRDGVYGIIATEAVSGAQYDVLLGKGGEDVLDRGDAMIGTGLARERNLRPGSTMRIATPKGFVPVKVAGIWVNAQQNGFNVTLSVPLYKRLFGIAAPHDVLVRPERGVSEVELARRIEAADLDPDLFAMTAEETTNRLADEVGEQGEAFWILQRTLLFVALVGTLSTLLLAGIQRRREIGVLGAVGFTSIAIGRMTIAEALAAGSAGSLLGIIGSLAVFEVLRNAASVAIGVRPKFSFDPPSAVTGTLVAAVVVVLGAALPAWRAARVQIVDAIRDE
jgi:putative ABC transport system permease protein